MSLSTWCSAGRASGTVLLDADAGCPLILAGPTLACLPPKGTTVTAVTAGVDTDATGPGTTGVTVTAADASGAHASIARRVVIASASVKVTHPGGCACGPGSPPPARRCSSTSGG
jgi:hypothetical protein